MYHLLTVQHCSDIWTSYRSNSASKARWGIRSGSMHFRSTLLCVLCCMSAGVQQLLRGEVDEHRISQQQRVRSWRHFPPATPTRSSCFRQQSSNNRALFISHISSVLLELTLLWKFSSQCSNVTVILCHQHQISSATLV